MKKHLGKFLLLSTAALLAASCATKLKVESEPPGAKVLWSPTGVDDWREWPPLSWDSSSTGNAVTPFSDRATYSDTIWVTVEKEGYYRPMPQVAELMANRTEEITFKLTETIDAKARRLEADGFVLWQGEWVRPEENGLENFNGQWMLADDAFSLRQRAQGLVLYDDRWMAPENADRLFRDDQIAKGFVQFKDRWVSPDVLDLEKSIDSEVSQLIDEDTSRELRLPRVVGSLDFDLAQLQIHNSSRFRLRVLLSGPRSQTVTLQPYETFGSGSSEALEERLTLLPGRYGIAVIPDLSESEMQQIALSAGTRNPITESKPDPSVTEHPFSAGFQYLLTYNPEGASLEQGLGDYTPREAPIPEGLPTIEIPEVQLPEKQPRRGGGSRGGRP